MWSFLSFFLVLSQQTSDIDTLVSNLESDSVDVRRGSAVSLMKLWEDEAVYKKLGEFINRTGIKIDAIKRAQLIMKKIELRRDLGPDIACNLDSDAEEILMGSDEEALLEVFYDCFDDPFRYRLDLNDNQLRLGRFISSRISEPISVDRLCEFYSKHFLTGRALKGDYPSLIDIAWNDRPFLRNWIGFEVFSDNAALLVKFLESGAQHIRSKIIMTVGLSGNQQYSELVAKYLSDNNPNLRRSAITAIGLLNAVSYKDRIGEIFMNEIILKAEAIRVLARFGAVEYIDEIAEILSGAKVVDDLVVASAEALARMGAQDKIPEGVILLASKLLNSDDEDDVFNGLKVLYFADARQYAVKIARLFGRIHPNDDFFEEVREGIIYALGQLQAQESKKVCAEALEDDDELVVIAAVMSLMKLKATEYIDQIAKLMSHRYNQIKYAAVLALCELEAKKYLPQIKQFIGKNQFYLETNIITNSARFIDVNETIIRYLGDSVRESSK